MKVPLLDLKAQHDPIRSEISAAIEKVLDSNIYILGPEVKRLEQRVADYSGAQHGIGVSSGTDALLVALMALDLEPGDEVITTDYSFFATAGAIARVGAKPVFVDIDPATYNLDPNKIEAAITSKTRAIIVVHLFGQCADMAPIIEIGRRHNLKIIEDAAQAIGVDYSDGRRAGSIGDIGCFSFFPSKNLGALGDGGMVVTSDDALAEKMTILRAHGGKPKYHHKIIGGNFRLDAIQAAVLNVKLGELDKWTKQRQENADAYVELFKQSDLLEKTELRLPAAVYERSGHQHHHIYNQFIIRIKERDALRDFLKSHEIGSEVYYPIPFHLQECFQGLGYHTEDFPLSRQAAQESLALPVYPGLTRDMQQYVIEVIHEFYRK